jgi:predicted acyl esterase
MSRLTRLAAIVTVLVALPGNGAAVPAQAPLDIRGQYTKTEHLVPMRDGVKLFTIVYSPKSTTASHPFMLHRTPYGSPPYGPDTYRTSLGPSADFASEKFVFVYQDVRGKFRSEGEFVVMRPLVPACVPSPSDRDPRKDTT